jgi:tetratricopeptide (TPR) repeat protein
VIPSYITALTPLAAFSKHQKVVASLLSQAHQLASLATLQEENFGIALSHCDQASRYGQLADDPNLQASSLIRRSNIQFYRNCSTLEINRQAMQYIDQVTPLLKSRLYSAMGADIAGEGQEQEAIRYVNLAQDTFPEDESDPAFLYTRTTRYILYLNAAVAHLRLDQPQKAFNMISRADTYVPEQVSSRRAELLKHLTLASASSGDLEQSNAYFEALVATAIQLDASLWYTELFTVYQKLQSKWPRERRIKQLAEVLKQTEVAR